MVRALEDVMLTGPVNTFANKEAVFTSLNGAWNFRSLSTRPLTIPKLSSCCSLLSEQYKAESANTDGLYSVVSTGSIDTSY